MVNKMIRIIAVGLLLSACTTDPVEDESFEGPTRDFPLLGNVPERPKLPNPHEIAKERDHLQADHDEAHINAMMEPGVK